MQRRRTPTRRGCSPTPRSSGRRTTGAKQDYVAAQGAIAIAQKAATDTVPDGARRAVFYRPGDLKLQLQKPLGETLPAKRLRAAGQLRRRASS